jgi:hypothetical protein
VGSTADDPDHPAEAAGDDVDAAVAALYAGPPDEFVAGRDALVRSLRAAARRDDAAAVKALRRPKAVARALNAARRHDPAAVADLVRAADAVGHAQQGGGDVRTALDALRAAERAVTDAALAATAGGERGVDAAATGAAVRAVLADPDALAALHAGRLVEVPAGGGFATFDAGATIATGPAGGGRRPAPGREAAADAGAEPAAARRGTGRQAVADARRADTEAEETLRLAVEAAEEIAPAVAEAEAAEQAARDAAEAANRAADEARERALELARRATSARREAATLARRRDQAEAELDRARARLARSEGS